MAGRRGGKLFPTAGVPMSSTPKFRRENSVASDLRAPPHSIEAEQAVLGGLMLDRAAWDNVGDVVTADDFFRPDHRIIFESIASLAGEAQDRKSTRLNSSHSQIPYAVFCL